MKSSVTREKADRKNERTKTKILSLKGDWLFYHKIEKRAHGSQKHSFCSATETIVVQCLSTIKICMNGCNSKESELSRII